MEELEILLYFILPPTPEPDTHLLFLLFPPHLPPSPPPPHARRHNSHCSPYNNPRTCSRTSLLPLHPPSCPSHTHHHLLHLPPSSFLPLTLTHSSNLFESEVQLPDTSENTESLLTVYSPLQFTDTIQLPRSCAHTHTHTYPHQSHLCAVRHGACF